MPLFTGYHFGFGVGGDSGPGFEKPAGPWGPPNGHTATGGMISDYTDPTGVSWRAHVFTHPGTFTIASLSPTHAANMEVLVVGAGGGNRGGGNRGGGYGGGGGGGRW